MRPKFALRLMAAPALAAGAITLAGCSSDSTTTTAAPAVDSEFAQCMAEQGIEPPPEGTRPPEGGMPPSGGGAPGGAGVRRGAPNANQAPPGVDTDAWQSALQACADYAPGRAGAGA